MAPNPTKSKYAVCVQERLMTTGPGHPIRLAPLLLLGLLAWRGAPLVGLRHPTIVWAGHRIVRSLQPLFRVDGAEELLGGSGRVVVGIRGRHGADLDALGLLECLSPPAAEESPVRLTFSGRIDGSEQIVIGAESARWENVHWGVSRTTVQLGGIAWTPRENPVLPNLGATTCLPVDVDFSTARLVKTHGRDIVALVPGPSSVTVRIADGPNGTDLYEFSVLLARAPRFAELSIRATIDGSDELFVTVEKAVWRHRHWGWPRGDLLLNDTSWDPRRRPEIPNVGATRYLSEGVDLASARVVRTTGRDLAVAEVADDHRVVRFADTPVGAGLYEVVIRFGPDPGPRSERTTFTGD